MSDTSVITVENLAKRYVIGHETKHDTFRDRLAHGLRGILRHRARRIAATEEFWALRDISFEVNHGEVIGIIGRNGAGKSTLLKILSRITEPTQGRIALRGRVASLLEVGTGFHPELTGRENIFLNGAVLGMSRVEIRKKFDEIVDFAEVERFLDTPVKRYSSGMYVRLAFAVAAHLEPEILIVDEVLAVGDAEFQRKCLGKMREVARGHGRTVLFVSHNLAAIQTLCGSVIYLADGRLVSQGETSAQLARYAHETSRVGDTSLFEPRQITPRLRLQDFALSPRSPVSGGPLGFRLFFTSTHSVSISDLCLFIHSDAGIRVAVLDLRCGSGSRTVHAHEPLIVEGSVPALSLVEGEYSIGLYLNGDDFRGDLQDIGFLAVAPATREGGVSPYPARDRGFIELPFTLNAS